MVILSRKTRPLLTRVNGKPHASDDDHEETSSKRTVSARRTPANELTEEDINRDPESSSDGDPSPRKAKDWSIPSSFGGYGQNGLSVGKAFGRHKGDKENDGQEGNETPLKAEEKGSAASLGSAKKRTSDQIAQAEKTLFDNSMGRPAKRPRSAKPPVNIFLPTVNQKGRTIVVPKEMEVSRVPKQTCGVRRTYSGMKRSAPAPQTSGDDKSDSEVSMEPLSEPPTPEKKKKEEKKKKAVALLNETANGTHEAGGMSLSISPRGKGRFSSASIRSPTSKLLKLATSKSAASPAKTRPNLLEHLSEYGNLPTATARSSVASTPLNLDTDAPDSSPLSSFASHLSEDSDSSPEPSNPEIAECPLCHQPIPAARLAAFRKEHPRMNVRDQGLFCHKHKRHKAEEEYAERGYPSINWSSFDKRMEKHYPRLKSILLNRGEPSHYRSLLEEKVRRGEDRTLLSTVGKSSFDSSTTGYYGSRGARVMMEAITRRFAGLIREVAVKDKVVSFGGIGNFVQRVLVPELSLELVREDLGVGEEEARKVVRQSGGVGELVNEEVEDEVKRTGRRENKVENDDDEEEEEEEEEGRS
ncbi:hypothetical protein GQ43DRAFT_445136 [Delitschia confertaspora ATCC 74209]|uniref:Restriction of telomere capping protein 4 n=1 Tax=Delitschia confertaspora ATCC 74209 TaxID=1513339 RepID=A0A9P4JBU9_9PLEO|nr:hypothetical protein GQ43DRAFT_445136 [Delitschia confertaspora ATCC 74209]